MNKILALAFITISYIACKPPVHTPKPRGYFKIALPERSYQMFDSSSFPYSFEYPVYGQISHDAQISGNEQDNPYWINIEFPEIGGKIYISYKNVNDKNSLPTLNEDMYKMTYTAHDKKADYIEDYYFQDEERRVFGTLYRVSGDAASAYQFFATDSTKHFIRGALYFDVAPNADSLKPLNDFLKEDINHLLYSLSWN
ncbi:MAG: hypothetical protein H6551_07480 [Chitinophagales bacterium]|nr:hypothetical protein [Chitinophagaceae bacterium]MCB9064971.1 hypothetical protein [Chitinophagales bacterium]